LVTDPEIPGWEFELPKRSRGISGRFSRREPELTLEDGYVDRSRALPRMIQRLNDYDPGTFTPEPKVVPLLIAR